MLRSMFSAVSGLRSHQTMMDVTGNNVANVNTAGYKSVRTTFSETLTQVVRGGSSAVADPAGETGQGGINPMQLGLGARVSATDLVFSQGASQATGRSTDLAIQGDGFFVVDQGNGPTYTRGGAFSLDEAGNLVGSGGEVVQGWLATAPGTTDTVDDTTPIGDITVAFDLDADGAPDYADIAIGSDGTVTGRNAAGDLHILGRVALARFPNTNGLQRVGQGMFIESPNSGAPIVGGPGTDGLGQLQAGTLEMSNVDMAQEFTNLILAQRGFQANARTISASDELLQDLVNLKR